jgi:cellulose synthase/poly-beta-1,6-N-acetylglucosamine synthase-like glycosyltransferase
VWDAHGSAAARNIDWRFAAGKVIAFTDDDTIPRRDWVMRGSGCVAPQRLPRR